MYYSDCFHHHLTLSFILSIALYFSFTFSCSTNIYALTIQSLFFYAILVVQCNFFLPWLITFYSYVCTFSSINIFWTYLRLFLNWLFVMYSHVIIIDISIFLLTILNNYPRLTHQLIIFSSIKLHLFLFFSHLFIFNKNVYWKLFLCLPSLFFACLWNVQSLYIVKVFEL